MELLFIISVAWWFVNFEPLQLLFDFIFKQINISHLSDYIHSSLGCWKCWSFWTSLIYTGSFFMSCMAALIAYSLEICLNKLSAK